MAKSEELPSSILVPEEVKKETPDKLPFIWNTKVRAICETTEKPLSDYVKDSKVVMIVNVASRWGKTKTQYTQMVELYG